MTRTNDSPDSQAGVLISIPPRRAAALLVRSGMVFLTLTLLAAPLGAAQRAGVTLPAADPLPQADAGLSGTGEGEVVGFTDRLIPDPGRSWDGNKWIWRVPGRAWLLGVGIGFGIAGWLLVGLLATVGRPTLIEPAASPRWLGLMRVGSLAKDPLLWVYLLAAGGLAGAIYSGSFSWFSREFTERVSGFVKWAPTGALGLFGILFGSGAKRRMSRWKVSAHAADDLVTMLEEKSNSFLELLRSHVDDELNSRISGLATVHEVGLIQRTMWTVTSKAVDQGRLQPAKQEELMAELLEIQPGDDDRSVFLNRRAAVDCATRLVAIEDLKAYLGEEERRRHAERRESTKGPEGADRRTGSDRRVRSLWQVAGHLERELAQ